MPLLLDDLNVSVPTHRAVDAKFFSSKLTGSGKKAGLLCEDLRPVNSVTNTAYAALQDIEVKRSSTQHEITTNAVPLAPLIRRALTSGGSFTLPIPDVADRFVVNISASSPQDWDVSFGMTPQALALYEDKTGDKTRRDLVIQYRMELYFSKRGQTVPDRAVSCSTSTGYGNNDHAVFLSWDTSPMENARFWIGETIATSGLTADNLDDLDQWMHDYDIHERILRLARTWSSEEIADEVCRYIADMPANPTDEQLRVLAYELRYLENYTVPLEAYRVIHQQLGTTFIEQIATKLAKQNLSLLMNHTLENLDHIKPQLTVPPQPTQPVVPSYFSVQQKTAVTTHEPLAMTVAGAGTGKSSTILARIEYLKSCGVPAGDITVLSFTNAAADNITEKNPDVGSMTIARMIIDIYAMNHPTHKVSAIDTIINSIDIFYPNNRFAAQFRHRLLEVDKNSVGAFTALNTYVENHYDEVVALLDRIQQTSLELQIILCYQRIDTMIEPAHVQSKYLIIDEVQDNSIFEFIYVLKYITKHQQSLFIVGDASQTLYEFRSANPRALNTLEGSGVFTTYQLTTNYRSNQEILDFANVLLGGLETNQIAGIQLEANSLDVPTADSFREKVTVDYRDMDRIGEFIANDLQPLVQNVVVPKYVQACLDRGEQVAFLAHSRKEVSLIQATLERMYPNKHVASLVSDRVYATDIFSKYIKNYWNDVLQAQPTNAAFVVHQGIQDNLDKLTNNASNPAVSKAVALTTSQWWIENEAVIKGWVSLNAMGSLPAADFFEQLRDNLLSFEIRRNQEKLNVNKQKNQERKKKNLESKAELVVSTIHGAKGLEFDNVVVLYKEDSKMSEDTKRMFYVAFTRAMKSEYVLAYGTLKNPPIQTSHDLIVSALEKRDTAAAQLAAGADPDFLDDDTDEADESRFAPQTV